MKKLFGLLSFILIGLINFGYCDDVEDLIIKLCSDGTTTCEHSFTDFYAYNNYQSLYVLNFNEIKTVCTKISSSTSSTANFRLTAVGTTINQAPNTYYIYRPSYVGNYLCFPTNGYQLTLRASENTTIEGDIFLLNDLLVEALPELTSLQCQTKYNLIPISSVDQNYCVNNGLCPSQGDCPEIPGSGNLQYSNIYINDILHPGRQNIFINIPDYITWDYSQNEVDFNVYVGSGYDQDYIDSIISINSYRPDSGDFTDIFVSGLTLVFPYIVIVLFIVFVRRLLKRIFR